MAAYEAFWLAGWDGVPQVNQPRIGHATPYATWLADRRRRRKKAEDDFLLQLLLEEV